MKFPRAADHAVHGAGEVADQYVSVMRVLGEVLASQGKILLSSADVSTIGVDKADEEALFSRAHVKLKPLVGAAENYAISKEEYKARVDAIRIALQIVTQSAVTQYHPVESRDTQVQLNAIAAHMVLLRPQSTGIRPNYPMEQMLCQEVQAAIEAVYHRQSHDGAPFAEHHLLDAFAKYGTYENRYGYSDNARQSVDHAFAIVVNGMNEEQRENLILALHKKSADFIAHADHVLQVQGITLVQNSQSVQLRDEPVLQI